MRLLLDSHTLYWVITHPQKLAADARASIEDGANEVFASAASIWELRIKSAKGKLKLSKKFSQAVIDTGIQALPIRFEHADQIESLPSIHGDPFDRILVAQAMVENLILVTRDVYIRDYPIATMSA